MKKWKMTLALLLAFMILLTGCGASSKEKIAGDESAFGSFSPPSDSESDENAFAVEKEASESSSPEAVSVPESLPRIIVVYVCGAVESPGIVELSEGARVADAIAAAGGLSAGADVRLINQARLLSDGEQVTVLTEEEAEALLGDDPAERAARLLGEDTGKTASSAEEKAADSRININRADLSALMTLPGIGEAKAKAIIEYRETYGAFAAVEDVCNVSGVKGSVFEKIRDRITV